MVPNTVRCDGAGVLLWAVMNRTIQQNNNKTINNNKQQQ
jgi:hypothetical protein